jgi:hypothetical protein
VKVVVRSINKDERAAPLRVSRLFDDRLEIRIGDLLRLAGDGHQRTKSEQRSAAPQAIEVATEPHFHSRRLSIMETDSTAKP